jgi:RING-box protein 1
MAAAADAADKKEGGESGSNGESLKKSIVQAKGFSSVAIWHFESKYDHCSICKCNINDLCLDCQGSIAMGDAKCTVAWGQCNHAFHQHCLQGWLKSRSVCPMCSAPWITERVSTQ